MSLNNKWNKTKLQISLSKRHKITKIQLIAAQFTWLEEESSGPEKEEEEEEEEEVEKEEGEKEKEVEVSDLATTTWTSEYLLSFDEIREGRWHQ